jgi:hypothetical protein
MTTSTLCGHLPKCCRCCPVSQPRPLFRADTLISCSRCMICSCRYFRALVAAFLPRETQQMSRALLTQTHVAGSSCRMGGDGLKQPSHPRRTGSQHWRFTPRLRSRTIDLSGQRVHTALHAKRLAGLADVDLQPQHSLEIVAISHCDVNHTLHAHLSIFPPYCTTNALSNVWFCGSHAACSAGTTHYALSGKKMPRAASGCQLHRGLPKAPPR